MDAVAGLFGGDWNNGSNSGSRCSNWNNTLSNSNNNIGARAACDSRFCALPLVTRQAGHFSCGQPFIPALANTLRGSSEGGVAFVDWAKPLDGTMAKKYRNLYAQIIDDDNLRVAYALAARGKRSSLGYLQFKEYAELNLFTIGESLRRQEWQPGQFHQFYVFEPKRRLISAPSFQDRVVHHALCNVIEPIFDRLLLPTVFACRTGKGTHAGVRWVQSALRRKGYRYYLKTDFQKFFPSCNIEILFELLKKKISCAATLELIWRILAGYRPGLPIGCLTSQLFANLYANPLDRWLAGRGVPFGRYMDDVVVLGHDAKVLHNIKNQMQQFAESALQLSFSHWQVGSVSAGINFLGYRIWPNHKLLRKDSVRRARRKLKFLRRQGDEAAIQRFAAAWLGHARWADSHNLIRGMGLDG